MKKIYIPNISYEKEDESTKKLAMKVLLFVFISYLVFLLFLTLTANPKHNSCSVMERDIQSICKRRESLKLEEFKSCEDAYKNLDIFLECKK